MSKLFGKKSGGGVELMIGWTTLETEDQARAMAAGLVAMQLAVCTQVEGPIRSYYEWEGKVESSGEWRLVVKYLAEKQKEVDTYIANEHSYDVPQWVCVKADVVGEAYGKWCVS